MTQDQANATSFDESDMVSLGEKLSALDLTDREKAALNAVLSDDEVAGFAQGGPNGIIAILIGLRAGDPLPTLGGANAFPPGPPNR